MRLSPDDISPETLANKLEPYFSGDVSTSPTFEPTLAAAREQLEAFNPKGYASSRSDVDGNVSRLNPYITWGALSLREVADTLLPQAHGKDRQKFLNELGWKAFFREAFLVLGDEVYGSLEPYKYPTQDKQDALPKEIATGQTGLACMDEIVQELKTTGYLHNHKRLWFAAYLVHFCNVAWQQGEAFFYRHLLDGEPGPNALSWQWVASTFSNKPYYFNHESMTRYGHIPCPDAPFNTSYETLSQTYFGGYGKGGYAERPEAQPESDGGVPHPRLLRPVGEKTLVLLHAERLSDRAEALQAAPDAPVLVLLDGERFKQDQPSFMRLHWALSLAADVVRSLREEGRDAELCLVDDIEEVLTAARDKNAESIAAAESWHPGTWTFLNELNESLPVSVVEEGIRFKTKAPLRSFSSYWRKAEPQVKRSLEVYSGFTRRD